MKFIASIMLILVGIAAQAQDSAPIRQNSDPSISAKGTHDVGPSDAIAQLRELAVAYNQAMVKKDTAKLLSFYYDGNVPVVGAVGSTSFARMTAASGGKAPKIYANSAAKQSVGDTAAQTTAEKISNLTVHTDGAAASIEYDYEIPQGYGHTYWTLVATKDAWKITSIAYSINIRPSAK
ncbi:hypothetical protein C8J98_10447 [Luteibacter sp. OK325]|uniref:hypothetical protein n=1 Tax=Luteibacter sp. OK325 TaxID=2135670 RepID=UPI000D3B77DC|nr:hypothetical protein [Luteibacter sp. OK325]PTR32839.1 hypothetical protein C8J98_10447 [Luteibacter sp. OK325]